MQTFPWPAASVSQLEGKVASLRDELSSRQQSYLRREGRLREENEELKTKLESIESTRTTTDASQALERNGVYELHKRVLDTINGVVDIAEQKQKNADKDAMQHFRARLTDIERQVRAERDADESGPAKVGLRKLNNSRLTHESLKERRLVSNTGEPNIYQ